MNQDQQLRKAAETLLAFVDDEPAAQRPDVWKKRIGALRAALTATQQAAPSRVAEACLAISDELKKVAKEIADEGHNGWSNVCLNAAALLEASTQREPPCNYPDCKCPTESPCLQGREQPSLHACDFGLCPNDEDCYASGVCKFPHVEQPAASKPEPQADLPAELVAQPLTTDQRLEIVSKWRGRNWTVGDIIDAVEAAHGITGKDQSS